MVTLLGAVLAVAYLAVRVPQYTSTASVLVKPISPSQSSSPPASQVSMETEAALVVTGTVADKARASLGWHGSVQSLLQHVTVTNPSNTLVLDVSFTDPSPRIARRGAQAFANAYLAYRNAGAASLATAARDKLVAEIASLQGRITDIDNQLGHTQVGTPRYQALSSSKTPLVAQLALLDSELAGVTTAPDAGDLVSDAQVPLSPSSPGRALILAIGVLVGLFIGLVVAFLRDRRDDRPRGRADVEDVLGAPVLGIVPPSRSRLLLPLAAKARWSRNAVVVNAQHALALAVARSAEVHGAKTILIVTPTRGTEVAVLVANLAQILAHDGKQVLAMSVVPGGRGLTEAFDLPDRRGLTAVLAGSMPMSKAVYSMKRSPLRVLTNGPSRSGRIDLYRPEKIRAALADAAGLADVVLIEGEPLQAMGRGVGVPSLVDGTVLVVDAARTSRNSLVDVRWKLERMGAQLIGAILINLDPEEASRYDARALSEATPADRKLAAFRTA